MKPKTLWYLVVTWIILLAQIAPALAAGQAQSEAPQAWQFVAPGIDYQAFHINNPRKVNIFVTRMDRTNPNVTLESSIAQDRISGGTETVSGMVARYDQTINYWGQTWGNRSHVVAGINGYFFGQPYEPPGVPWRGQVQSGWYTKRFDDFESGSGFVWSLDGNAFIGGCVQHKPANQFITYLSLDQTQKFSGINVPRTSNDLIIYTPQFDTSTLTDDTGVEVLVELTRPMLILPNPSKAVGVIREIRDHQGDTSIPFDHVVLSATGTFRDTILTKANVGDQIGITQQVTHFEVNCNTPSANDWTKAYASIGSSFYFLKGGVVQSFPNNGQANTPAPRTAIAFNETYIYFIVADGRNPGVSEGMAMADLGNFALNTLQADEGVAQDGGGSSTLVVNGEVVNNTACNFNDCTPKKSDAHPTPSSAITPSPDDPNNIPGLTYDVDLWDSTNILQALVANGMMMAVVEPVQFSTTFTPTQVVTTQTASEVRLGPGTNYGVIATLSADFDGIVQPHFNRMNGVLAKGSYWWKVAFGNSVGWVKEQSLQGGIIPDLLPFHLFLPNITRSNNNRVISENSSPSPAMSTPTTLPLMPGEKYSEEAR